MPAVPDSAEIERFLHGAQLRLSRLAFVLAGDLDLAEELVQDTMVKVVSHWDKVSGSGDPMAYAAGVMINQWRDTGRRLSHQRRFRSHAGRDEVYGGEEDRGILEQMTLREAVSRLSAKQRAVIYFRFYEGLSVRATAERMSCSEGTVKSQTSYALRRLAESPSLASEESGIGP